MADGAAFERWYSAAELAELPGLPGTPQNVTAKAKREGWTARPRVGRGGGSEYAFSCLPAPTQAAILLRERPIQAAPRPAALPKGDAQIRSAWQRYDAVKQGQKDKAATRLKALQAVGTLVSAGTPLMQAREVVADRLTAEGVDVSAASIARWQAAVDGVATKDWLALLVPHYTGRTSTAAIEPQAWEIFKADYLRLEQPTASSCYDRLVRIANGRGWSLPSLKTFTRRIERELPRAVRLLAREGEEALMRSYPAQERDRSMFTALEGVNADGHRWDIRVRFPDGSEGRPCILGWQDLYSGKILAWRLCDQESSDVVRLSFGDMLRNYGVPAHVWLDNGRAFASKWMTGPALPDQGVAPGQHVRGRRRSAGVLRRRASRCRRADGGCEVSNIARHVIKGAPSYLIVRNARKVAEVSGKTIYQLDNDPLELGVYDSRAETLVVFDAPGLVALATVEVNNRRQVEQTDGIDVLA